LVERLVYRGYLSVHRKGLPAIGCARAGRERLWGQGLEVGKGENRYWYEKVRKLGKLVWLGTWR